LQHLQVAIIAQKDALTNPAAYDEAARFLRKLRRVWAEQGKTAAWGAYVEGLRAAPPQAPAGRDIGRTVA
jgi:uncharacterized Zn finger protein